MLTLKNINKKFGDTSILKNINLEVKTGEVLGFLGPNGAGKTTTMKIIASIITPDSGSVEISGINALASPTKANQKIGYLPETVPLYDDMKVKEYLRFFAEAREIPKTQIVKKIQTTAKKCGLSEKLNITIENLSRGYRQRVGLAQAIIHDPEVLILDEPTTGLDPNQITEIRDLIKTIGKEKTVIFSTHILSEARAISDKIVIINKGEVKATGSPAEIEARSSGKNIYKVKIRGKAESILPILSKITTSEVKQGMKEKNDINEYIIMVGNNNDMREEIFQLIIHSQLPILEFTRPGNGLEEVFKELTT